MSHSPSAERRPRDGAGVRRHERVRVAKGLLATVGTPQRPRHPDGRITPQGGRTGLGKAGVEVLHDVRHDDGYGALRCRTTLEFDVDQPVAEERLDVAEECGRGREDGDVTGPAEPLVTLRAVGGHAQEVAVHSPHDVAVQLIQQRIGALERADTADVGPHDDCGERRRIERSRPAGDLHIPEAVEGQRRLEDVVAAAQDESVRRVRAAQRTRAELIVLEHLGVAEHDLGARRVRRREHARIRRGSVRSRRGSSRTAMSRLVRPRARLVGARAATSVGRVGSHRSRPRARHPSSNRRTPDAATNRRRRRASIVSPL